jgi:hypothetical protein
MQIYAQRIQCSQNKKKKKRKKKQEKKGANQFNRPKVIDCVGEH